MNSRSQTAPTSDIPRLRFGGYAAWAESVSLVTLKPRRPRDVDNYSAVEDAQRPLVDR
jgi:hypothetical protein